MTTAALPALDAFFDRLRAGNPFLVNRVDRPQAVARTDVPGINEAAFRRVLALGQQARAENRGVGVVVWGEAGVGKSHLLGRLAGWAAQDRRGVHVYLHNLQASPERLPRTVLRGVLHTLTRGRAAPLHQSTLYGILVGALKTELRAGAPPTWPQVEAAYRRLVGRLAAEDPSQGVLFDPTVYDVLYRFLREAHPSLQGRGDTLADLAVRWLAGEVLEPAEAPLLGLPARPNPDAPVALADNQHVKQVLVTLTQVARAAGRLCLLCFDQVDNLDEDQVRALTRFLHDLLDSAGNLLVVTTGVQQTLLGFRQRGVITETSWDRVAQFEVPLGRLYHAQGWELLRARLRPFLEPFRGVAEVEQRLREDGLFPLGSAWFEQRVGQLLDFRPRDLIGWACERWQRLQDSLGAMPGRLWLERWPEEGEAAAVGTLSQPEQQVAIERAVRRRMAERKAHCLQHRDLLPADEDRLLGLVEAALGQCRNGRYALQDWQRVPIPKVGPREPYDLLLDQRAAPDGPSLRFGVRVLVADHGRTVTNTLQRIREASTPPGRVLLVTDARRPLPLGNMGHELLEELRGHGDQAFRTVELTFDQLADLDALEEVVRLARAGDFEIELAPGQRRPVTEAEVAAAHHREGRYLAHPLLRELLGAEARPALAAVPVDSLRQEEDTH